jgi:hypothetical protein
MKYLIKLLIKLHRFEWFRENVGGTWYLNQYGYEDCAGARPWQEPIWQRVRSERIMELIEKHHEDWAYPNGRTLKEVTYTPIDFHINIHVREKEYYPDNGKDWKGQYQTKIMPRHRRQLMEYEIQALTSR